MLYSGKTSGAAGIATTLALVLIGDSGAVGQAVMRSAMAYDSCDAVGSWESKGSYSAIELATIVTDAHLYRSCSGSIRSLQARLLLVVSWAPLCLARCHSLSSDHRRHQSRHRPR